MRRLKIKGIDSEFILVNALNPGIDAGAIATQEQYDNGEESFAYLGPDGRIMRHHQQIGTIADIEWTGDTNEIEVKGERVK